MIALTLTRRSRWGGTWDRTVQAAAGPQAGHWPVPALTPEGRWACSSCRRRLTRYRKGEAVRLRHHPRGLEA